MVVSSYSSSVQSPPPQHQVFINFRGKQLRNGKDLSVLFSRIEESRIALAIFSTLYTESNWCLNELEKIKECVDLGKLVVIPIFYKVETDDVKNLKGVFGDKFWELAKTCKERAGVEVDDVPIQDPSEEADPDSPLLYGIETRLKQLEEKIDFECESTLTVGVVGMPGIGKTTLTKMLYEKWQHKFLRCVFLHDVRKLWQDHMIDRKIFMKELLKDDDLNQELAADLSPESLKALLLSKKSLVVLDNVSDKKQIEVLLGECDWIKKGSLIFITTSDRSVIEGKVDDTYEVLRLSGRESFQYFSYFAFGGKHHYTPKGNFMNLSRLFADYAKGNPLALKILGVELNGKDEIHWEDKLSKLAQSPHKTIQNVLQISYDGLSELHKDVFLDVACFFRSGDENYVRCLVESCDAESIDAVSEIKDLASKFFIDISGGRVEMHDLLYTFGKELGSQGSWRLWNHKGVVSALKKRAGAESVRGIFLDMSELKKKLPLEKCTFTGMRNLRYLKFYNSCCHRECEADCKLSFPEGLELPLDKVRYLYWLKFPLKKLPKDFNPKNLTDLNLPYSEIEEIWEGVKATPKLKWVDLSYSSKLSKLSGLQNAESLQRLSLEGCTCLQELPREMNRMKRLVFLNMRGCTSLRFLPHMNLISMKTLILTNCSSLQEFRVISDNLETLKLDGTAISQLPANMVKLQRLMVLNLKDCIMLREVPESLGKLKALQELVLSGCSKLKTFPISIENMKCLQILLLDGTEITEMPRILEDVRRIKGGIMNGLSSLRHLCLSRNDMISNLQVNISQLYHLRLLDVKYCKNLTSIPLLPPNLEVLDAHGCEKLKTVATPMALLKLMEQVRSKFIFTNCNNLEQVSKNSITVYAQRKSQLDAVRCYKEGNVSEALLITSFPGSEVPSWFNHRTIGSSLKLKFPPHWCDNRLSTIVLCAVVSFPNTRDEINRFSIECTCEFTNELGTCVRFSCTLGGGWIEPRKIDSDHVFIGYTSCSHLRNHVEGSGEQRKCVPTEASIEFEVRDGAGEIVNCGLSLVYEEPNHVVTEGDCNETSSTRDLSARESIASFCVRFVSTVLKYLRLVVAFFLFCDLIFFPPHHCLTNLVSFLYTATSVEQIGQHRIADVHVTSFSPSLLH
ncbi:ADP-ribosyl cyclase/cyclic ADP-ribose hydrolase [Hirschfeldia incana]|nr:ADP-ribosyl cyclase/cyclic ADP-ribose hydrolase [Hirschfeldia incana]